MADYKISNAAYDVLKKATVKSNVIILPPEKLERDLYEEVNKALTHLGGRWVRSTGGHEFHSDPTTKLAALLETGVAVDVQKKYQAFYTPPELANEVVMLADVAGHFVLEPSAGQGALVSACLTQGAKHVQCVELNPENLGPLGNLNKDFPGRARVETHVGDFLACTPEMFSEDEAQTPISYKRIVMNPPFTKAQDIEHVEHALGFLAKEDGILVAIMADNRTRPKWIEFEAMLNDAIPDGVKYSVRKVPAKTFKDTDIATLILRVEFHAGQGTAPATGASERAPREQTATAPVAPLSIPAAPAAVPKPKVEPKPVAAPKPAAPEPKAHSPAPNASNEMKLTVTRADLLAAITAVKSAAATKSLVPILANVLLRADKDSLTLTSSDTDVTLRRKCPATVHEQGRSTVLANLLYDIARQCKGETVDLELAKSGLNIVCGDARFKLAVLDPEDFPPFPRLKEPTEFVMEDSQLKPMLGKTVFATSRDTTRPILNGSLLRFNGNLQIAACDGHRVGLVTGDSPLNDATKHDLILPAKAVRELLRLLDGDAEAPIPVSVNATANIAQFTFGDTILLTKLLEGEYPNYAGVIPDLKTPVAVISRAGLLQSVQLVSLVTTGVKLEFRPQSLVIRSARAPGEKRDMFGDASDSLLCACTLPDGVKDLAIKLSTDYLLEALAATTAADVELYAADDSVLLLKVPGENWLAVIASMGEPKSETPEPAEAAKK